MSVQSFGANILDAKVKSLKAQHDLQLSTIDANGFGREYTHHINGPNVANPNNYVFSIYEKGVAGEASSNVITVTTSNGGAPPFNNTFLSLKASEINIDGLTNFINNANNGQATLTAGAAPSKEVTGGIQNVTTSSVIMLTQASPNTGGTNVAIPLYVEAGVSGNGKFTIYTTATLAVDVKVNYSIVKY